MTALEAAELVLREEGGPLHYREITKRVLKRKLWETEGKTPWETVNARMAVEIQEKGAASRFVRVGKGTFALRKRGGGRAVAAPRVGRGTSAAARSPSRPVPAPAAPPAGGEPQRSWRDAIMAVLKSAAEPLHYSQIAEEIAERKLRADLGATPAATVGSIMSVSIKEDGERSPYVRLGRGMYTLRSDRGSVEVGAPTAATEQSEAETGLIHAFGMFWRRDRVLWSVPRLLGRQQADAKQVDFAEQNGVYLLYDGGTVSYVGRVVDRGLAKRLKEHTVDRLEGRWDRFSWFGVRPVQPDGKLSEVSTRSLDVETRIVTMEALLIEAVEPRQNRKRGDDFRAVEFMQVEDPEIAKSRAAAVLDSLRTRL